MLSAWPALQQHTLMLVSIFVGMITKSFDVDLWRPLRQFGYEAQLSDFVKLCIVSQPLISKAVLGAQTCPTIHMATMNVSSM